MIKRPHRDETEEDLLRMQQEFLEEKNKNPKHQPAAKIVKVQKVPKKSLFVLKREQENIKNKDVEAKELETINSVSDNHQTSNVLGDIVEKSYSPSNENINILPYKVVAETTNGNDCKQHNSSVLGDIVEKHYIRPKSNENALSTEPFPVVDATAINFTAKDGKSLFALSMEAKRGNSIQHDKVCQAQTDDFEAHPSNAHHIKSLYGNASVMIDDVNTGIAVHNENLQLLTQMNEEAILAERRKLLESIDPSLVALLAKRRKEKSGALDNNERMKVKIEEQINDIPMEIESSSGDLSSSNAAVNLLERSNAENWLHFDIVEKDKLTWMQDIPRHLTQLKPGEQFEARFDWKGVLMPYTTNDNSTMEIDGSDEIKAEKDERELYLHGDEPNRPGYTLQELFRLARSNIMQQRVSAFGAIAGILNIYNQGFYDQVLELPISKIFFLLRFGLDDNTPALLEVISKALAYLFYNESDEMLLDLMFDNPALYWQPILKVSNKDASDNDDNLTSLENLQKQMKQMQMGASRRAATPGLNAKVVESEAESQTSMSDFQLAETDLVECFLRTNILQRIYYILNNIQPDNSTVSSCLKILIRLARSSKEVALQIVNNELLLKCLLDNFLPGFEVIDTTMQSPPFYGYPQYLCLKLVRVLIAQNLSIALKFVNYNIVGKLQNYLFNHDNIRGKLIRVQIEALRVLRCLLLLRVDVTLSKKFLPAFRYMLEWHFNHVIYEVGGSVLIRQHAAALLASISAGPGGMEASSLLGDLLYDCCSNWFHRAVNVGVKEFSQATLLSECINSIAWYTRHCGNERFHNFITKYLRNFIQSTGFDEFVLSLPTASILLREAIDRRLVHPPLPNVGSVLIQNDGSQLIVPQIYAVPLLTALWRLLEVCRDSEQKVVLDCLMQPRVIEPVANFLGQLGEHGRLNRYFATNFYAKGEVQLISKLLCFNAFEAYFDKPQMLQIVYNFLGCLTAEYILEIEQLFERVIFNSKYLCDVDEETLNKWRLTCLELVHSHYITVQPMELTLSLPFTQTPILPNDWPYFQLRQILQNYLENVQLNRNEIIFSESEVVRMTFTFVEQLEQSNSNLEIATPTEKLMYLMIVFMGPESNFLEPEMATLLQKHIVRFYAQHNDYSFQFEEVYGGKCKFENLYALFVDHFQAASYGNELFGSLVLIPLAQKYDSKWRRRLWSDYAAALRFLDCNENLLLGGLQAYIEPIETDESLLRAYAMALKTNALRPHSIPYKIAQHHVKHFQQMK